MWDKILFGNYLINSVIFALELPVDCLKTILSLLKKHIIRTNFHKKTKSTKIIKSIKYFLLSEKSIKLSTFWFTFLKSGSAR